MPVSSLPSDQNVTPTEFYVVKVFGSHRRAERTVKILRDLRATDQQTACVCQDDLMREALREHGISCLSFYEEIDEQTELEAWSEAIRVNKEIFARISRPPFIVEGYECSECLLTIYPDRFAFVATLVLLRENLSRMGFTRVILLLAENYLGAIPDVQQGLCRIVASRSWKETLKDCLFSLTKAFVTLRNLTVLTYGISTRIGWPRNTEGKNALRVLIVVADYRDFPSYYSRPAAAIAAACLEQGHQPLIATNLFASPAEFVRRGFKPIRRKELVLMQILSLKQIPAALGKILRIRNALNSARASCENVPGDLWDFAYGHARSTALGAFGTASTIDYFHRLFTQFSPDVLVAIPDGSFPGMAAVAVARKKGIPALTTLAGQIFDHPQYGFLNADVIAVNGDSAREVFLKRGISPQRVVVTGMAHYDETWKMAQSLRRSRKTGGLELVVFATENLPLAETFRMISPFVDATLAIPRAKMVIRPHPRENPSIYKDFVRKFGSDRIAVNSTTPLLELLSTADVCVTGFSNVAVEAMMLDRPVICVNLSGEPDKLAYVQEGAALGVYEASEASSALDKALHDHELRAALDKGRRTFLERHFCGADGNASLRIVKLLEKLAERRGSHR